jgi:hypothetical protein
MKLHTVHFSSFFTSIPIGAYPAQDRVFNHTQFTNLKRRIYFWRLLNYYFLETFNSVASDRKQTVPTERPPLVGEVCANFSG